MNNEIKELKIKNDKILSIKYNNVIFNIGDKIDLKECVNNGIFDEYIIEEFQNKKGPNKYFKNSIFPKYTIITNCGCIDPINAAHVNYTTEKYKLNNTECLSIVEIMNELKIFPNEKKHKKLLNLVKDKLENK